MSFLPTGWQHHLKINSIILQLSMQCLKFQLQTLAYIEECTKKQVLEVLPCPGRDVDTSSPNFSLHFVSEIVKTFIYSVSVPALFWPYSQTQLQFS